MKKINEVIYNKILLQAEVAKELGFDKLAEGVIEAIGSTPKDVDDNYVYSSVELEKNVYKTLWRAALQVVAYHNLKSVDIQKVDDVLAHLTNKFVKEVEGSLNAHDVISELEPKLPGQS